MEKKVFPKGSYKIGLDTCFLIQLATRNIDINKLKEIFFPNKSVFFYANITEKEFKGVLKYGYGYRKNEADRVWQELVSFFNLEPLFDKGFKGKNFQKIKEVNEKLAKDRDNPNFSKTFKIGFPDMKIISCFMGEGMDRVYSSDEAFRETCKKLNLNAPEITLRKYMKMEE